MPRIKHLLAALALLLWCHPAHAQDKFPSKPIKVVVPFGAGSATDIVIRIVGEQMRHDLGQQVVVENKPGAFGILATRRWHGRGPTATRSRSAIPAPTC
jgi:tripartite-type tricarboxylate transporter receptor subunit TctC